MMALGGAEGACGEFATMSGEASEDPTGYQLVVCGLVELMYIWEMPLLGVVSVIC